MAERRTGCGTWLLGAVVVSSVSVIACCGCGGVGVLVAPNAFVAMIAWLMLEDAPLGPPPVPMDAATREAVVSGACADLWAGRPTKLDPTLITGVLAFGAGPEVKHLAILPTADGWDMAVSIQSDPDGGYLNFSGAGAFTMERGWFTDTRIDAIAMSGWHFDEYLKGQQLAPNMNQSLANQRAENPALGPLLDSFEKISTAGGQLELVPGPGTAEQLEVCAPYRPIEGQPSAPVPLQVP